MQYSSDEHKWLIDIYFKNNLEDIKKTKKD